MKVVLPGERMRSRVIVAPHVSEKATNAMRDNQYVFRVFPSATRVEVRAAVETYFDVKVKKVNLLRVRGKRKGQGRNKGRRIHWKKAYVSLEPGYSINLTSSE